RRAFEHFGGVPAEVVLDNTRTAVKCFVGLTGREETPAFLAFRTYYVFRSRFCNPRKANEKGLVENLVRYARRNFLVPMPEVSSTEPQGLEELNRSLLEACEADRGRQRAGENRTVGELYEEERAELLALPERPYECAARQTAKVDSSSRIRFETNAYSVPWQYVHRTVEVKAFVDRVAVVAAGWVITEHRRSYGRHGQFLKLDHYLEILRRKPGVLKHFRGWLAYDLPEVYGRCLRPPLCQGRKVKEFIDVLILRRDHPKPEVVDQAVETALQRRCAHYDASQQLAFQEEAEEPTPSQARIPDGLQVYRVQSPDPTVYRHLVGVGVVAMAAVQAYLKELRLPAFARLLPETLREAESQGRPFLDVLRVLLEGELAQRQINQGRRRIREARFPYAKDLAEFDFTANPTIKKSQILSLARGEYLAKRQNVIFLGNSGT